jgi:hypothetical protein
MSVAEDIRKIIADLPGPDNQRRRLMFVADRCAKEWKGNLAEIGAGAGGTTVKLAAVARKWGRRVIAVDPWVAGAEGCREEDPDIFAGSTLPYGDIVETLRLSSLSAQAVAGLAVRPLCFAYVDGLARYETAIADIATVGHAPVVAVGRGESSLAVKVAARAMGREILQSVDGERYLI